MYKFTLSGFADEIHPDLGVQMEALKKLRISHIEMRGVNGKNLSDCTLEEAASIKKDLDNNGFSLSSIGSPIGKIKITEDFEPHFEKFLHVLELAKLMNAPYIRMFSFYVEEGEWDKYREEVFVRMKRMVDAAKEAGVTLLHENEKHIYGDTPERCLELMKAFSGDGLRAVFDPANFVQCGVEPYPHAYKMLKPYIAYMHIKDAKMDTGDVVPAGQGDGNVPKILEDLAHSGYQGFLSLEPHLTDFVGFAALEEMEEGEQKKESQNKGEACFALATDALRSILDGISAS